MNPLLMKDLLALLRLRRVVAIQYFFLAVLGVLVLLTWPQGRVISLASAGQDDLFLGLILGQLILLILFVPGVAAVSLSGEREANTLEMLYASSLSPAQTILGKVAFALSYPMILLVSGLPFIALLTYRGAVNLRQLGWAYVILLLAAALLAIVSLAISSLCRQSSTALLLSYASVLALAGVVLIPAALLLETQSGASAAVLHYGRGLSPVAALLSLLRPSPGDFDGRMHEFGPLWQVFMIAAPTLVAAAFVVLVIRLAKPPADVEYFGHGESKKERSLGRKILFLIDPKKQRKPIRWGNPIYAKERRTSQLRSGRWMIRVFYGTLCLSMGLALMSLYGGTEHPDLLNYVARVLVILHIAIVLLIVPSLSSAAISGELENGTFELLRLAPLSGGQIFWGKLVPALLPALLLSAALLPAYGALCYLDMGYLAFLLRLAPVVMLAILFCCVLGLTCSSFLPSTSHATVTSYLVAAGFFVLPALASWAGGVRLTERTAGAAGMCSPLVMSVSLMSRSASARAVGDFWAVHLGVVAVLCLMMLMISRGRLSILLQRG